VSARRRHAVIVDDERLARFELRTLLEEAYAEQVHVVGEAASVADAARLVHATDADVVFLDIQLAGETGMDLLPLLGADVDVVFVTAYDEYTLRAFEVNAVDYLLKPVDATRLEQALQRARRRLSSDRASGQAPLNDQLERIVKMMSSGRQVRRDQVAVKVGERFLLVHADDIIYASLADESINIVTGHVTGSSNYRTLDDLQARLDPDVFWRVHRSHLVNINKIKEIVPWFSRNYILRMKDAKSTEIPVSRSQTKRLREYLKL
jgi:two-component system, LytTR family, response regulator